jgi:hypothetical protein
MSGKFDLTLAALAILSAPFARRQQANPGAGLFYCFAAE